MDDVNQLSTTLNDAALQPRAAAFGSAANAATTGAAASSGGSNFFSSTLAQSFAPTQMDGFGNAGFEADDESKKAGRKAPRAKYVPAEATDERVNRTEIQAGARYAEVTADVSVEVYGGDGDRDLRIASFEHPRILPQLQHNIKTIKAWDKPSAVQSAAIPLILAKKHDMMVHAPTGQGKTAAFLIPLIQTISCLKRQLKLNDGAVNTDSPFAIIFLHTRDLADQVWHQARQLVKGIDNVKAAWAYGQTDMNEQHKVLQEGCDIVCFTEGRGIMLFEKKQLKPHRVRFFVIDEADKLLSDCDMMPKIRDNIKAVLPTDPQSGKPTYRTLMFSATFTQESTEIAEENFLQPGYFVVRTGKVNQVVDTVRQEVIEVSKWEKRYTLLELLKTWRTGTSSDSEGEITHVEKTLVFMQVKRQTDWLANWLCLRGIRASCVHGNRSQQQRADAFAKFRDGTCDVLVASDIAARGLNLGMVDHVVVFDLHGTDLQLVHRIGRTGRMGNEGHAVVFFDPYEENNVGLAPALVRQIEESGDAVPECLRRYCAAADEDVAEAASDVGNFD